MLCAVYNCANNNKIRPSIHRFYSFPKDKELLEKWIKFCRRNDHFNIKNSRICSAHFCPDDFIRNMQYEMGLCRQNAYKLKPGTVPTLETTNLVKPRPVACKLAETLPEPVAITRVSLETRPAVSCITVKDEQGEFIGDTYEPAAFVITLIKEEVNEEVDKISHIEIESEKVTEQNVTAVNSFEFVNSVNVPSLLDKSKLLDQIKALQEELEELQYNKIKHQKTAKNHASELHVLKRRLVKAVYERDNMQKNLLQIFSTTQVNCLMNGTETQAWTEADMEQSNVLYSASAKAYKMLRKKSFPLPDVETLKNWKKKKAQTSTEIPQTSTHTDLPAQSAASHIAIRAIQET